MRRLYITVSICFLLGAIGWSVTFSRQVASPASAQEDPNAVCTDLVRQAIQQIGRECAELGINEACYGHALVEAIGRDGGTLPTFNTSGDTVALADLAAIFTRPYNAETQTWGVALMHVKADLPESVDETLRFVLMGDASVTNMVEPEPTISCTATNTSEFNINVRSGPNLDAPIIDLSLVGESLTVTGQTETGWLRARLEDGSTGWVSGDFFEVSCAAETLPTISADEIAVSSPMQVIQLSSNSNGVTCGEAPNGLLIEAPEGQTANVIINGVEMRFASSGFVSVDGSGMSITGLTGEIIVHVPEDAAPFAPIQTAVTSTNSTTEEVPPTDGNADPSAVAVPFIDTVNVSPGLTTRIEFADAQGRFLPSRPDVTENISTTVEQLAILRESVINRVDYDQAREIVTNDLTRIRDGVQEFECRVGEVLNIALPPTEANTTTALNFLGGDKGILRAQIEGNNLRIDCENPGLQALAYGISGAEATRVFGYTIRVVGERLPMRDLPDRENLPIRGEENETPSTPNAPSGPPSSEILPSRQCHVGEALLIEAPPMPAGTQLSFAATNPDAIITPRNLTSVRVLCIPQDFSVVITATRGEETRRFIIPIITRPPDSTLPPRDDDPSDDPDDDDGVFLPDLPELPLN